MGIDKVRLFFDLDGTLIDARKRLYDLFQHLVPGSDLTIDEYWELKRNKNNHKKILMERFDYNEEDVAVFEKKWLGLIETEEYLSKDVIFNGVIEVLEKLKKYNKIYLVSARQSVIMAINQLKILGLSEYLNDIFITGHKFSKAELILNHFKIDANDFIVGDTGHDIMTGKELGIKTVSVTYGFLSKKMLLTYNPDYIFDNIRQITELL
jgi:phosphoglycolate phosphatase